MLKSSVSRPGVRMANLASPVRGSSVAGRRRRGTRSPPRGAVRRSWIARWSAEKNGGAKRRLVGGEAGCERCRVGYGCSSERSTRRQLRGRQSAFHAKGGGRPAPVETEPRKVEALGPRADYQPVALALFPNLIFLRVIKLKELICSLFARVGEAIAEVDLHVLVFNLSGAELL